jgi:hypothetical protein
VAATTQPPAPVSVPAAVPWVNPEVSSLVVY